MPVKVHIYVATTRGLVALQNMTLLEEQGARSLVTIDGSARLAGISSAYDLFVNSPAGLIKQHFGGEAYRINVGNNIDQGESWQLGFYLAHLFHANKQLSQHEITEGEIALCVTGAVSTYNSSVKEISALDKKINAAKGQIMHWMNNGVMVQWIMPEANNVGDTLSLPCSGFGVSTLYDCANKLVSRGILRSIPDCVLDQEHEPSPQLEMSLADESKELRTHKLESAQISERAKNKFTPFSLRQKKLYVSAAFLCVIIVSALTLALSEQYLQKSHQSAKLILTQSQSGRCDQASYQNTVELNNLPVLMLPDLSLPTLCEINFELDDKIKSVWLISDSGALIRLAKLNQRWQFPLPERKSIDRRFTLVLSERFFDESDYQSLNVFINNSAQGFETAGLVKPSEAFDIASIAPWFAQQQYSVDFYVGQLSL